MIRKILIVIAFYLGSVAHAGGPPRPEAYGYQGNGPGGEAVSDINMSSYDITNVDDQYQDAMTTDAAVSPAANTWTSKPPYPGVGATNTAGGNLALIPASGANNFRLGDGVGEDKGSVTDGSTITITVINMEGALVGGAATTLTEGTGAGGTWDCAGAADDPTAVCNLYTVALAASAAGGFTVLRTDSGCSDERLVFLATPGTSVWVGVVASDTDLAITQGTDGQIFVQGDPAAASVRPSISTPSDTDSGFGFRQIAAAVAAPYLAVGGTPLVLTGAGSVTIGGLMNMGSNSIYSSSAALDLGGACAPVGMADASGNACFAGEIYRADRMTQKIETLVDGDTTPDVSGSNYFVTPANTGATVITDLDNPVAGQIVTICIGSATNPSTIADAGNFNLSAAWSPGLDDCIHLLVQADNDYIEIGRSDN